MIRTQRGNVMTIEEDSARWALQIIRRAIELRAAEHNYTLALRRDIDPLDDAQIDTLMHGAELHLENLVRAFDRLPPLRIVLGSAIVVYIGRTQ